MSSDDNLPARNAPFHNPQTTSTHSISRQGRAKMFHPLPGQLIKDCQRQWSDSLNRSQKYHEATVANRVSGAIEIPVPSMQAVARTPRSSESNVGTGTKLSDRDVFFSLGPGNGMLKISVDAMTEFICDYANRWYSTLPSSDPSTVTPNRHLPGTVPMFAYWSTDFHEVMEQGEKHAAAELAKRFSREEFWQLRYFFFLIQTGSEERDLFGHVAVCAISPEAKTIDYLCSADDDGLIRGRGAQCVENFLAMLTIYLGDEPPLSQRFNPCDWKLRTGRSELQDEDTPDCGIYSICNIMCLAFGWGLSYGARRGQEMQDGRIRICSTLHVGGFRGYNPAKGADNTFYYPLNNLSPPDSLIDNFVRILHFPGLMINETLTAEVRRRSPMYYGCPNKETLYAHCDRNKRFYPNFDKVGISGRLITFAKFLSWVERYDLARERDVAPFPKPYLPNGFNGSKDWIPPSAHGPTARLCLCERHLLIYTRDIYMN
ncbi:hypothetical protein BGAL_0095g00200 [Botrytis galanthina]|uniref:Ubiquitin-like protease family profile domain-containing protein n=1 Tax=Botrytis galanthina TaxID=278940 RepID=A0A4S8REJ7_9HELO|nr:hypothetical protein BGAL_0095g00200 [Botrytis galanthina]